MAYRVTELIWEGTMRHPYNAPGAHNIVVKVINILGNNNHENPPVDDLTDGVQ